MAENWDSDKNSNSPESSLASLRLNPIKIKGPTMASTIVAERRAEDAFDVGLIEAKVLLRRIFPEHMPKMALDALEAAHDGVHLMKLAALDSPTRWEVEPLLPGVGEELGFRGIDIRVANLRLAQDLARRILRKKLDPISNLAAFTHFWVDAGCPIEISILSELEGGVCYSAALLRPGFMDEVMMELHALAKLDLGLNPRW